MIRFSAYVSTFYHSEYITLSTHSCTGTEHLWHTEWGGPLYASHGTTNARGVIILLNRKLKASVHQVIQDKDGRF